MALDRKLGLTLVTAALLAVTMGCGGPATFTGKAAEGAGNTSEDGKSKLPTKLKSGQALNGAEKGAIMSAKGHGDP